MNNVWRAAPTALGTFHLATDGSAITRSLLPGTPCPAPVRPREPTHPLLAEGARQLAEWAAGRRADFDVPLRPEGTPFQVQVWEALARIPYGATRTYGQVAAAIGRPGAARAVGQANNRNPLAPFIPCHRVTAATGLGGYGGGLPLKQAMLAMEQAARP